MNAEQFQRIEQLFERAVALAPQEQETFVRAESADDPHVCRKVLGMLEAERRETLALSRAGGSRASAASPAESDSASAVPREFGRYRIERLLGRGGMGEVFLATQDKPNRTVALKLIRPDLSTAKVHRRFEWEAEVLGRLTHPGIAQIYDAGVADIAGRSQPFIAMESVQGQDLCSYAKDQSLDARARLKLLTDVCDAVHYAHQKGVIHRDLKPSNILVEATGRPKILDFGIAIATDAETRMTTMRSDAAQIIGTLAYMSPEQLTGRIDEVDTRSDVYSLGVVAFELLAECLPHDLRGRSLLEAARIIRDENPTRLSTLSSALRGDLDLIVRKALEKEPALRYQSVSDFAADITRHLLDQPILARPPSVVYQVRKFVRRNKVLVASAAVLALAVGGGIVGISLSLARALSAESAAVDAREDARREAEIAKAVNDFLNNDILSAADPGRTENRDITVRQAIDLAAEKVGERFADRPLVEAEIRSILAVNYNRLGDAAAAETHHRRAVELYSAYVGADAKPTMDARNSLATNLMNLGRFAEAAERLEEDRRVLLATRNEDDGLLVRSTTNLATAYLQLGRFNEAAPLLVDSLAAKRRTLGDRHESTLTSLNNLAGLYSSIGRNEDALALYREAYEGRREVIGEGDPRTLSTMSSYGRLLTGTGHPDEGRLLLEGAMEIARKRLSPTHPILLRCLNSLAVDYAKDKPEEAIPLLRELVELRRGQLGPSHMETLNATANLAETLVNQGGAEEAAALCRGILDQDESQLPADHNLRGDVSMTYGLALEKLGELRSAEAALLDGRERFEASFGRDNSRSIGAAESLAAFYDRWDEAEPGAGHADAAARWRASIQATRSGVGSQDSAP